MTLPNFLILGAAKAGTTTLHAYLRPHPEVFVPARKELRFFAYGGSGRLYLPGEDPRGIQSYFADAGDAGAVGEASPQYLRSAVAATRIKETIPGCRLVISLRNPVDQAFSGLSHGAPQREGGARHAALPRRSPPIGSSAAAMPRTSSYMAVFDRSQFHIIRFESLVRDPLAVAQALYGFLGVATDFARGRGVEPGRPAEEPLLHRVLADKRVMDLGKRYLPERWLDAAKRVRNDNLEKQHMSSEEREAAMAALRSDILRTGDLVGLDLTSWLRMPGAGGATGVPDAAAPAKAVGTR